MNIDQDEHIVVGLPKIWSNTVGVMGFFKKSREGILVLTNKKIIFVPKYMYIPPRENTKYFGNDEAKVTRIDGYSDADLDEDIEQNSKSILIPFSSIVKVESVKMRKVNFLRISFKVDGRKNACDFGLAESVTNYPIRQPLLFHDLDWKEWVKLVNSCL